MTEFKEKRLLLREQLNHELTCTVCVEYFNGPILLPCSHSFCRKCIQSIIHHNHYPVRSFDCPLCRQKIFLKTVNTIDDFPKNLALENLVKLHTETKNIFPDELFEAVLPKLQFDKTCCDHLKPLCLFCETCSKMACPDCFTVEPCLHHTSKPLEDICTKLLERINTQLISLKEHYSNLVEKNHKLKTYFGDIDKHKESLTSSLESECEVLTSQLKRKYEDLKASIQLNCAASKRMWIAEKEICITACSQIEAAVDMFTRAVQKTSGNRVFNLLNDCDAKMKPLTMTSQYNRHLPFLNLPTWNTQHEVREAIEQITLKQECVGVTASTQTPFAFGSKSLSTSFFPKPADTAFESKTGCTLLQVSSPLGHDLSAHEAKTMLTKHECIMKEYENKSLDELRLEYYSSNLKGTQCAGAGGFSASAATASENPIFTFGQSKQRAADLQNQVTGRPSQAYILKKTPKKNLKNPQGNTDVCTTMQSLKETIKWPQQTSGSLPWANPLGSRSETSFSFGHQSSQAASVSDKISSAAPSLIATTSCYVPGAATSKQDTGFSTSLLASVTSTSTTTAAPSKGIMNIPETSSSTKCFGVKPKYGFSLGEKTVTSSSLDTCLSSGGLYAHGTSTNSTSSTVGLFGTLMPSTTSVTINTHENSDLLGACGLSAQGPSASFGSFSFGTSDTTSELSRLMANIGQMHVAQSSKLSSPSIFINPSQCMSTSKIENGGATITSMNPAQALKSASPSLFAAPSESMSTSKLATSETPIKSKTVDTYSNSAFTVDLAVSSQKPGSPSSRAEAVPSTSTESSRTKNLAEELKSFSPSYFALPSSKMTNGKTPVKSEVLDSTPVSDVASSQESNTSSASSSVESFSSGTAVTSASSVPSSLTFSQNCFVAKSQCVSINNRIPEARFNYSNSDVLGACAISSPNTFVSPSHCMFTNKITNAVTSSRTSTLTAMSETETQPLKLTSPNVFVVPLQCMSTSNNANNGTPITSAAVDRVSATCVVQVPPGKNSTVESFPVTSEGSIGAACLGPAFTSSSCSSLTSLALLMPGSSKAVTTPVTSTRCSSAPLFPCTTTLTTITSAFTNPTQSNFRPIPFVPTVDALSWSSFTAETDVPCLVFTGTPPELTRGHPSRHIRKANRQCIVFKKNNC